jgi:hypothetical protein
MNKAARLLLTLAVSACGPGLATRYEDGNRALSAGEGAMYFVVISPLLQQALNACIPAGTANASPMLVLVADVDRAGGVHDLDIEPDSAGTACVEERLMLKPWPKPPLAEGAKEFPVGLRIDTR